MANRNIIKFAEVQMRVHPQGSQSRHFALCRPYFGYFKQIAQYRNCSNISANFSISFLFVSYGIKRLIRLAKKYYNSDANNRFHFFRFFCHSIYFFGAMEGRHRLMQGFLGFVIISTETDFLQD